MAGHRAGDPGPSPGPESPVGPPGPVRHAPPPAGRTCTVPARRGHQEQAGGHGRRLGPQDASAPSPTGPGRRQLARASTRPRGRRPRVRSPGAGGRPPGLGQGRRRRAPPAGARPATWDRLPRAATPAGTGPPPPGPPAAAARGPARRARSASAPTERSAASGTIRSTPSSVSFWTTHSGRSPLTGAKATTRAAAGAGRPPHGPSSSSSPVPELGRPGTRQGRQRPGRRRPPPARPAAAAGPGPGGAGPRSAHRGATGRPRRPGRPPTPDGGAARVRPPGYPKAERRR